MFRNPLLKKTAYGQHSWPDGDDEDTYSDEAEHEFESFTIPSGTTLYHGTTLANWNPKEEDIIAPAWFSRSRSVAEWFANREQELGGKPVIVAYRTMAPIELPVLNDSNDLNAYMEKYGMSGTSAEEIADTNSPGWIIPNNYPDGDDIVLVDVSDLQFVGMELFKNKGAKSKIALDALLESFADPERAIHQQHSDPDLTTQNGKMMGKGTEVEQGALNDAIPGSLLASRRVSPPKTSSIQVCAACEGGDGGCLAHPGSVNNLTNQVVTEPTVEDATFFKESDTDFEVSRTASGRIIVADVMSDPDEADKEQEERLTQEELVRLKQADTKSYGVGTPNGGTPSSSPVPNQPAAPPAQPAQPQPPPTSNPVPPVNTVNKTPQQLSQEAQNPQHNNPNGSQQQMPSGNLSQQQLNQVLDAIKASSMKIALNIPRLIQDFGGKLEERYAKEYKNQPKKAEELINLISSQDPTPNKEYTAWLVGQYAKGDNPAHPDKGIKRFEDIGSRAIPLLRRFHELKKSGKLPLEERDIAKIQGIFYLNNLVDKYRREATISNRQQEKQKEQAFFDNKEATLFYNDAQIKVVIPHTEEASCFFGVNTRWCTAATESSNEFESYDGELYIVLIKAKNERYQFHFPSEQFMDEKDRPVDTWELVKKYPILKRIFGGVAKNQLSIKSLAFIENPSSEDIIRRIRTYPDDLDKVLETYPNLATKILAELARDTNEYVRYYVAINPNTPPNILTELARDTNASIRSNVAKNPNTPPNILTELAKDTNEYVRVEVAVNPNTPPNILTELAKDTNEYVRVEVAINPNTPPNILTELARDTNEYVRVEVAINPNTPPNILTELARDTNEYVRAAVAKNPNYNSPSKTSSINLKETPKSLPPRDDMRRHIDEEARNGVHDPAPQQAVQPQPQAPVQQQPIQPTAEQELLRQTLASRTGSRKLYHGTLVKSTKTASDKMAWIEDEDDDLDTPLDIESPFLDGIDKDDRSLQCKERGCNYATNLGSPEFIDSQLKQHYQRQHPNRAVKPQKRYRTNDFDKWFLQQMKVKGSKHASIIRDVKTMSDDELSEDIDYCYNIADSDVEEGIPENIRREALSRAIELFNELKQRPTSKPVESIPTPPEMLDIADDLRGRVHHEKEPNIHDKTLLKSMGIQAKKACDHVLSKTTGKCVNCHEQVEPSFRERKNASSKEEGINQVCPACHSSEIKKVKEEDESLVECIACGCFFAV